MLGRPVRRSKETLTPSIKRRHGPRILFLTAQRWWTSTTRPVDQTFGPWVIYHVAPDRTVREHTQTINTTVLACAKNTRSLGLALVNPDQSSRIHLPEMRCCGHCHSTTTHTQAAIGMTNRPKRTLSLNHNCDVFNCACLWELGEAVTNKRV